MDEAVSGHDESDEDRSNSPVSKQIRKATVVKRSVEKSKKKRNGKTKSPLVKADSERQYRSASIVPSSSEEDDNNTEDEGSEENLPSAPTSIKVGRKRHIEQISEENEEEVEKETEIPEQEEVEEVMEINFGSSEEDEEDNDDDKENAEESDDNDELPPVSASPSDQRKNDNKKRKLLRVGIGRPKYSSQGKLFDLTSRSGLKKG